MQKEPIDRKRQREDREEEQQNKTSRRVLFILVLVILILLMMLIHRCACGVPTLNPDYPPKNLETHAEPIPGDDNTKLEHSEGGGAVSLQFRDAATIDLSDNMMYLSFANPGRSTQDMLLQVTIQDEIIAQSGRLVPGFEISKLDLVSGAGRMLSEGIYDGMFVITYYDPDTSERAMVNTDSPVKISVQP